MKISIIIPVYNVAEYVGRCLDSVIGQTYPDVECIIVDDCGPDNSMEIVKSKLADYAGPIDFKVIRQPENGGIASSRNEGFKIATGDYVYFLDSDDFLVPDTLALLAEPLKTESLDLVVGGYASDGTMVTLCPLRMPSQVIRSNDEIIRTYVQQEWYPMVWNKLVRRQLLIDNDILFENLLHEDELWSFQVAAVTQSMACVNQITYIYCFRSGSFINTKDRRRLDGLIEIAQKAENFVQQHHLTKNVHIGLFLFLWRERLGHAAWLYGKKTAYEVYCRDVLQRPAFIQANNEKRKWRHRHHILPRPLGFIWYMGCKYFRRKFSSLSRS